jgi:hypothetical protein
VTCKFFAALSATTFFIESPVTDLIPVSFYQEGIAFRAIGGLSFFIVNVTGIDVVNTV